MTGSKAKMLLLVVALILIFGSQIADRVIGIPKAVSISCSLIGIVLIAIELFIKEQKN